MQRGSKRYTELVKRLNNLQQHLLSFMPPSPSSIISYTDQQLDFTRAYVLLSHAEIEGFCEDIAKKKVQIAKHSFDATGKVTPLLRTILKYHVGKKIKSWSSVKTPSPDVIDSAIKGYLESINSNHGIKSANLAKIFYPLGISEPSLDATWLVQMDLFGENRGGWAHNSFKARNAPDPGTELKNITYLKTGLLKLDRLVSSIH